MLDFRKSTTKNEEVNKKSLVGLLNVKCWIFVKNHVKKNETDKSWSFGCQMLDFSEIDDKKICVQTSFSRIPLRICLQIKVNLENFVDSEKRPQKKAKSEIEILILV